MKTAEVFCQRRTGVLLHISSLPSGDLGEDAYRFVDFLQQTGSTVWQILPLGPTHSDGSPYQCLSAHAGNPEFISFDSVKSQSWITDSDWQADDIASTLERVYKQFKRSESSEIHQAFNDFCQTTDFWLTDYVLFREIREQHHQQPWYEWPQSYRDRDPVVLKSFIENHQTALDIRRFEQFIFFYQWQALKNYANEKGIKLFGDMPIFVAHDSADVWSAPELFTLDAQGHAEKVAGVPPDYFSATGQRWGNPLYQWQRHIEESFAWWLARFSTQLSMFDLIRIDHFRGFEACWVIPASSETAIDGQWEKAPGEALFSALLASFGELPVVAEDLGIITDEVTALRERYAMPGMKILQFAYGGDASNPYLPHQHEKNTVIYTGTHDNDTTVGWYESLEPATKQHFHEYIGSSSEVMPLPLVRQALISVAQLAILPMQDLLGLDGYNRMNTPGTTEGNWRWQFQWDQVPGDCASNLHTLNHLYGRLA